MLQLTKEEVVKYRKAGLTFQKIADIYTSSRQRVYQILTEKPQNFKCLVCKSKLVKGDGYKYCLKCAQELKITRGEGLNVTRNKVRKRDNYTCQDCGFVRTAEHVRKYNQKIQGQKGRLKSLDVHHLNGLCGKRSKSYDKESEMDTLITLCHKCHYNRAEHKVNNRVA